MLSVQFFTLFFGLKFNAPRVNGVKPVSEAQGGRVVGSKKPDDSA